MVSEIINMIMTIWMQLMWKVVRPEELKLGDPYLVYSLCNHQGDLSFTLLLKNKIRPNFSYKRIPFLLCRWGFNIRKEDRE